MKKNSHYISVDFYVFLLQKTVSVVHVLIIFLILHLLAIIIIFCSLDKRMCQLVSCDFLAPSGHCWKFKTLESYLLLSVNLQHRSYVQTGHKLNSCPCSFLQVRQLPPSLQKHTIGKLATLNCPQVWMCVIMYVHGACRVYSHLTTTLLYMNE